MFCQPPEYPDPIIYKRDEQTYEDRM